MGSAVSGSLASLLLRQSEGGQEAVLWGRDAAPHFGPAFDRLLAAGVLVERAPATSWSTCRRCDGTCDAREIVELDGELVAECPHYRNETVRLARHEVRSFSIDVGTLVAELARTSSLAGEHELVDDGIWLLGRVQGGRYAFLVTSGLAFVGPAFMTLIASRAPAAEAILVLPAMAPASVMRPFRDAGCDIVTLEQVLAADGIRLDVSAFIPRSRTEVRLIIDTEGRTATLDGHLLDLTAQPYRLLLALARAARTHRGFVGTRELEVAIYAGATQPAARLLSDIVRDLRDRMGKSLTGSEATAIRALVENKPPGQYRLTLGQEEIALLP